MRGEPELADDLAQEIAKPGVENKRTRPQPLAEKHGRTTKQIYEILDEQRKLHRARVQPGLFGEG